MSATPAAAAEATVVHARTLCTQHDNLSRVLQDLRFPTECISDGYDRQSSSGFAFKPMLKTFLYKRIKGLSQAELASKLHDWPYLVQRFGLERPPRQQTLSHTARERFPPATERFLDVTAEGIAAVAAEQDVIATELAPPDPSETEDPTDAESGSAPMTTEQIQQTARFARNHALTAFDTGRAANKTYSERDIFEMQSRMCMSNDGAYSESVYGWLTGDEATPHWDTHLRAIKKLATPAHDEQTTLNEFTGTNPFARLSRIRETVLDSYSVALENIMQSVTSHDAFSAGTTAAIDITHTRFYVSPWQDTDEREEDDVKVPKPDYPRMVNGHKANGEYIRAYKFATLTIVGDNAPIVLGIVPVKEASTWEGEGAVGQTKADIVEALMQQAEQYVEIDTVLCDREFESHEVYHTLDQRDVTYLIPKKTYTSEYENIERVREHPSADAAVEPDVPLWIDDEESHTVQFLYVPSRESDGEYAVFVTNEGDISPADAKAFCNQYRRRWEIENEYKTIKGFLPRTSSTDFRIRLFHFVFATLMYNLWRLTDYLLKVGMGRRIRSKPLVPAAVFARCVGSFLRPGG